eukprot:Selendium_serpulae@DN6385_c0_g1_i1.p2
MKAARDFSTVVTDPDKFSQWVKRHSSSVKAWAAFFGCSVLLFYFFSDGDFSFLLTLSSLIGAMSFLMVAIKIENSRTVTGVSLKMIECYVILLFARLCSIIPFEGYLPYDRTGDWMYQATEALALCLAGSVVYMCRFRYRSSYDPDSDTLNHGLLIVPALVFAMLFHPSLNAFMPADVAWTFALYLEAFAALPQLVLFQRKVCCLQVFFFSIIAILSERLNPSQLISLPDKSFRR